MEVVITTLVTLAIAGMAIDLFIGWLGRKNAEQVEREREAANLREYTIREIPTGRELYP